MLAQVHNLTLMDTSSIVADYHLDQNNADGSHIIASYPGPPSFSMLNAGKTGEPGSSDHVRVHVYYVTISSKKLTKPTAGSSRIACFGLLLSAFLQTKRIVPHSFAIDGAWSLTFCECELFEVSWPLARPRAIISVLLRFYGWRHSRDLSSQALPFFSVQHWKTGSGLGTRLVSLWKCR